MTAQSAYAAGDVRATIEMALRAAGKDPAVLEPDDLLLLEDFHTLGRFATAQLAELAQVDESYRVLDAGAGIGGTARFLASTYRCHVTAIDRSPEYCGVSRWLDRAAGLADNITVTEGDVTSLPFPDASFDVVFSMHVQMNVADKRALYREAFRVLVPGGKLAIWDVTGVASRVTYPVPWAVAAGESHLATSAELRRVIEAAGLSVVRWNDLTGPASEAMEVFAAAQPPGPLGLHVYVPDFPGKIANLVRGFADGTLQVVQALAVRPDIGEGSGA